MSNNEWRPDLDELDERIARAYADGIPLEHTPELLSETADDATALLRYARRLEAERDELRAVLDALKPRCSECAAPVTWSYSINADEGQAALHFTTRHANDCPQQATVRNGEPRFYVLPHKLGVSEFGELANSILDAFEVGEREVPSRWAVDLLGHIEAMLKEGVAPGLSETTQLKLATLIMSGHRLALEERAQRDGWHASLSMFGVSTNCIRPTRDEALTFLVNQVYNARPIHEEIMRQIGVK